MSDSVSQKYPMTTKAGLQLYLLLPEIYRREGTPGQAKLGDLAKYLDAFGELLDQAAATLDQRVADNFPDKPAEGLSCQDWILPYFAQLLDVRLVSPEPDGQREEVANAVRWRQRKGTVRCAEQIAQSVGRVEVEVHEGWKRVAVTPRVDMPVMPARLLGIAQEFDKSNPLEAAKQPGLPAVTADFRQSSRAVLLGPGESNPAARVSRFAGEEYRWYQANPNGNPCYPGSYQDNSRRTPDLRSPSWCGGHCHHKRLLLFSPPPGGFFEPGWDDETIPGDVQGEPLIQDSVIDGNVLFDQSETQVLERCIVTGTVSVTHGRLEIKDSCVHTLTVTAADPGGGPVLIAKNALIDSLAVNHGLAQFEYLTVLGTAAVYRINASDCVISGDLTINAPAEAEKNCVRYSSIPPGLDPDKLYAFETAANTNTEDRPVFQDFEFCEDVGDGLQKTKRAAAFGEYGCGVLHPASSEAIQFGAEDGGEMGAYHRRRYCLNRDAIQSKLEDYVPLGIEVALITDVTLTRPPHG